MVDIAREFGVSVFIYSSSQLVQNSFDDSTYNSEFFAGKLAVERYIQSLDQRSLGWMYVNTCTWDDNGYALLTALIIITVVVVVIVESSVPLSSWRPSSVNQDLSSLGSSPWV